MTAIQVTTGSLGDRGAGARLRADAAVAMVAAATLAGLALRVAGAQGDLWLDEIWSLRLVAAVQSPGAVFWGISHDNNHFLNSLWLYALGPGRAGWIYRAAAVALGTLSIPLAARIGFRRGSATGVAAAWLTALAMPLVVYGSEARGYAGLVLATLAAVEAFEPAIAAAADGVPGWRNPAARRLGLAVALGALFHLTAAALVPVLGFAGLLEFRRRGLSWRVARDATMELSRPSVAGLVPALAALAAGVVVRGGFTFGGVSPFEAGPSLGGYGGQLRAMLGLPVGAALWCAFAAAGLLLAALPVAGAAPAMRRLAGAALVVLPGAMALARMPNLEYPRYFLVPGVVLLLALAEVVGGLWRRGGGRRAAGAALLAATLAGQAAADRSALAAGRGRYGDALALMAAEGVSTYAADQRFMVETVALFTGANSATVPVYLPPDGFCTAVPDWYVDALDAPSAAPASVALGPGGCRHRFERRAVFPTSELSGTAWTLYRRAT